MTTTALPETLRGIIEDFQSVPDPEKLELLLEFSDELPALPERYAGHEDEMEQVIECQSPLFLAVELHDQPQHAVRRRVLGPEVDRVIGDRFVAGGRRFLDLHCTTHAQIQLPE